MVPLFSTIKTVGKIIGWIALIAGVVLWLSWITNGEEVGWYTKTFEYTKEDDVQGWLALLGGIAGFISSLVMVGIGQLIEDTGCIRYALDELRNEGLKEKSN